MAVLGNSVPAEKHNRGVAPPRISGRLSLSGRQKIREALGRKAVPLGARTRSGLKAAPLQFPKSSLAPQCTRESMAHHYDDHFLGCLEKLNVLIRGTDYERLCLEDIIVQADAAQKLELLSIAGTVWNHGFFWRSLSPLFNEKPDCLLAESIERTFGSQGAFEDEFVRKGSNHFGSGWLWLAWQPGAGMVIETTDNAKPIWLNSDRTPLLVCDMWEHAYYLDWKDDRPGFLRAFIAIRANWRFAGAQLGSLLKTQPRWTYPS